MSRSDDERVADILEAADELATVVEVGRDAFAESLLHRRAAERLLEIIGEASTALTDDFMASHMTWHGEMSARCGSCWPTTTTGSTSSRSGRSPQWRFPIWQIICGTTMATVSRDDGDERLPLQRFLIRAVLFRVLSEPARTSAYDEMIQELVSQE